LSSIIKLARSLLCFSYLSPRSRFRRSDDEGKERGDIITVYIIPIRIYNVHIYPARKKVIKSSAIEVCDRNPSFSTGGPSGTCLEALANGTVHEASIDGRAILVEHKAPVASDILSR